MDEEVVIDLFNRAKSKGYTKSIEDFKLLLETDEDVIVDNFNYVKSKGYTKPIEDFKVLVKKKEETTELVSPQEEVVTTSDTEEVETPGVSDVSVSDEVVETTQEPTVDTPEVEEVKEEEEVDTDKLAQQQSQIDQVLSDSFRIRQFNPSLKESNEIPLSILDEHGKTIMMAENDVAAEGLQKIYRNYGFTFKDTGLGTMTVKSSNGNITMIDTDTWTEDGAVEEAQKLKSFLEANKGGYEETTLEKMYESSKTDDKNFMRYYDEDLVNQSIEDLNTQIGGFQDKGLEFQKNKKQLEQDYNKFVRDFNQGLITPEQVKAQEDLFRERGVQLESKLTELKKDSEGIDDVRFKINEVAGEHVALEAQKGNWVKSWWKSFVNTFDAKNASITGGMVDVITTVMGEEGLDSLMPLLDEKGEITSKKEGETNAQYRDRVSKKLKGELKPMIRTALQDQITGGVTNEYQQKFQQTTWGMVSTSMSEMAAHMLVSGGRADAMAVSFGLQINDAVFKEMESEEFKDISESEKAGIAGLVSITSGLLESFGASKILNKSAISKSILLRVLGKVGTKATYETVENMIELEIKNLIAKGGLKVLGSSLVEAGTEASQEVSERLIKDIYNTAKGKEFFTKESTEITLANVGQAAKLGFLAGGAMGGLTASVQAYRQNGINKLNNEQFELAKNLVTDPKMRQLYTDKIKVEIADGTTNKSKAEKALASINEMVSIFEQIPGDIDVSGQKEAFTLLQEKARLQKDIAGKNESLTKNERTRISDIDTRLERISETKTTTDAVQEQTTEEGVLRPEETKSTEQVELQEVGQPQQEVTTEVKEESLEKEKETLKKEGDKLAKKYDELVSQGKDAQAADYFEENLQPLLDRRKAITEEINKIKQEAVEETPTTEVKEEVTLEPAEQTSEVEAKKTEIAKRKKQLKSTQEKTDREYQEENWTEEEKEWNLKAGDNFVEGLIIDIAFQEDLRTDKSKDGVRIVTNVVKKGTSKTRQKVDLKTFDSQEAADQWAKEKAEKIKNLHQQKLDKIDAKYETKGEQQTSEVEEEVELDKEAEKVAAELEEMDSNEVKEEAEKAKSATKIKEKARQLAKEILRNKNKYRAFIDEVGDSSSDMANFIAIATTDYINGKTNEIVEKYSEVKKKIEKIVRNFKKAIMVAIVISAATSSPMVEVSNTADTYIQEVVIPEVKALPSYVQRFLVKEYGLDIEESVAPNIVEKIVKAEVEETGETTITLPESKINSIINEKRDGGGVKLSQHSNYFNNEDGFVYNPIPTKGNRNAPKKIDGAATAHFFILDERPGDFKDIYDADNKELQRQSEWFKNRREFKSAPDSDFFPVFTKLDDGGVRVTYKKKSEITKEDAVIQKLVQYKASDIDFSKSKPAGEQYSNIRGYKDYKVLQTKDGKGVQSVIFKNDSLYSKFSGAAGLFIAETPNGKRFVKDFSGSVKNMKDGLKGFAEVTGVKEGDITIAFYDAGSVTAKPAGKNGKINRKDSRYFNTKPYSVSGLALPVGFEKQTETPTTEVTEGDVQLQLEAETTSEQTKQKLEDEAIKLLDDVIQENDGKISEDPFTAEQPAPGAEIITIEVKENSELAAKVKKMGLGDLVGKRISLVMADQLKVDKKKMGGPFFPLIDKLFGKVAWASMDKKAAAGIINGAIKSDYSVVYNMSPSAIDSNSIIGETLIELLEKLPKSERQEVFELMKDNVLKSKAKDFVKIKEVFEKSKTLPEALSELKKLSVDERAALLKKVVPSRDVKATTPIGVKLQENNITIEGLRELNVEQFVSELPAGAMTMVLEVTDKAGNKITEQTRDEAFIMPEQQREEGLPEHPNYPVYIRGKAIGILTETTPFFNVLKDVARNIEVKISGIVKQKSGRRITSKEARSNEMRAASMAASRAQEVSSPEASRYEKFISVLKRSFPSVEVVTTQAEFDTLLKETGAKQLTTKDQKVYGAVYKGKLYLNPSLENYNTPIHEFGHVWMNVAKESAPELYKKGIDLIKGPESDYEAQVRNNPAYQKVIKQMKKDGATEQEINDYVQEEALATAIGDKGESFVGASQRKNFKEWLKTLYGFVKRLTGISKYTAQQLEDVTLDEFTQAVAVDLLSGEQLFKGAEIKDMGDALQLMTSKERVDSIIEEIITKVENRNVGKDTSPKVILKATIGYLQGSKLYSELTDTQRNTVVVELNKKLGIKIPKAPSVKKILGTPKKKKVVVDEMAALKDQIKVGAKVAKGVIKDLNTKRKELAESVKDLKKRGKITANQARVIINKISSVNLYNPKSVDAFVKYMEKVYNNAEYANKVMDANALRKRIKKGAKNKKKDAKLTELATSFSAIDPRFVENIDEYLSVANSVLQGVVSSRVVGTDVNWRTSPDIVKVDKYINSQLTKQREILLENKRQEFETITGIAASELSYDDMMAILETTEEVDENKEKLVRDNVKKVFNAYKSIINNIISTGRDPFTGEKIDAPNKKIIKEFMDMNLNDLTVRESIEAVDALNNYVTNGITSGMETVVSLYRGAKNTKELTDKGVKATRLRLFGLKSIGRMAGEQITSLPILFERMFKGVGAGRRVMKAIGITDAINGVAKARKEASVIIDSYVNKFSKTKPNGKVFNDAYNITERGVLGFMRRTVVGEDVQQQQEFDRRKALVEQSIEKLETGTEQEQTKAKEYREVFDAVLKDAKSIEEVENNANETNLEAVEWWNEKWANYYEQLADVSLNVYNKVLGSDVNYIPDSFKRTQEQTSEDFEWNESAFAAAQNALYQKKTGILEEATRPKKLPKDRYISLDFDTNNAALLEAALVDINTAAPIQQLKGSIESKYFNKLVPTKEDREVLIGRLKGYVRRARGKDFAGGTTAQEVNRVINFIAGLGVSRVLGGITQPIKQTIPVAINTLINAGRLDLKAIAGTEINQWLDKSGYGIANRGIASETTLDTINRSLEQAAKSKGKKALQFIEKANQMWLKTFLVKPDAAIARASWISYYKQSLKKQGINSGNIDWATHELNNKAADYAQHQVDRQQNVSDADLQGNLMTSKKPIVQITRKVLIPFMNFVLNQKARMYSDIITLSSKTSSVEDRKTAARSLSGLMAETATFNGLSVAITSMLFDIAKEVMGYDEPEEDKEKRIKNKKRGVSTNVVTDVLSPFPILDYPIVGGVNSVLDLFQMDIPEEEKFTLFNMEDEGYLERAGVLGIAAEKLIELESIREMAINGTATTEFMGKETTKELPTETKEVMESVLPLAIFYNLGLLPSEFGSEIRYITKIAKKTGKTEKQKESDKKKKEKEKEDSKRRKRPVRARKTRKRRTRTR